MNSQLSQNLKPKEKKILDDFRNDTIKGLTSDPKKLSSKYFYDKTGDHIFQQIMQMPEYYLTNCELDIFKNKTKKIVDILNQFNTPFDLIELGAGDAMKSTFLLKYLNERGIDFTYMPIDISRNILSELNDKLSVEIPTLEMISLEGEYFSMLKKATNMTNSRKVVLFLGGNIGNMDVDAASQFCKEIRQLLHAGDIFFIGFDLKKNPHTILNAYNDPAGITASFNLNLLMRINRELDADFDINQFEHYQTYDPITGACRSYLVSLCDQNVQVGDACINFIKDEIIDMENSQKFSYKEIQNMAENAGFRILNEIKDAKEWFMDSIWLVE